MNDIGKTFLQLIEDFVRGDNQSHKGGWRFLAAWWGSATSIFAAYVTSFGEDRLKFLRDFMGDIVVVSLLISAVYAALFSLVITFGVPKGSLVRHFMYGVVLPSIAWVVGATMIRGVGG